MSDKKVEQTKKTSLLPDGFATPCGDRMAPIFEEVFDEELQKKIVKQTGEFDIYEEIQMSSNGSEITMLKRAAKNSGVPIENDPNLVEGFNQSVVPSNIHEAMRISSNVQQAFAKLPADVQKDLFKGNANDYLKAVIDGSINQKIGNYYLSKTAAQPASSGVSTNE